MFCAAYSRIQSLGFWMLNAGHRVFSFFPVYCSSIEVVLESKVIVMVALWFLDFAQNCLFLKPTVLGFFLDSSPFWLGLWRDFPSGWVLWHFSSLSRSPSSSKLLQTFQHHPIFHMSSNCYSNTIVNHILHYSKTHLTCSLKQIPHLHNHCQ